MYGNLSHFMITFYSGVSCLVSYPVWYNFDELYQTLYFQRK
jgi:hypothetical protein